MTAQNPSIWTYWIQTFGCKVNQYESQAIREHWLALGAHEQRTANLADVIFIHSCAVTAEAVADARQALRKALRMASCTRIIVTGCAAQVAYAELASAQDRKVFVIPNERKAQLLEIHPLDDALLGCRVPPQGFAPNRAYPPFYVMDFWRSRPVLKVQDGCSHRCTYCIVPTTRGPAVSRPLRDIIMEARLLLHAGFRELIISGINLSQYGRDLKDSDFWTMLVALEASLAPEWADKARLRISSLEPGQLNSFALDVLAQSRMICPQLHLSLQSGSPAVLQRMGRGHYQPGKLLDQIAALRRIWPVFGLGADILIGFPAETEEEFQETLNFVNQLPLSYAHVFAYSQRPGTPAAAMSGQVPSGKRHERADRVRMLMIGKKQAFLERLCQQESLLMAIDVCGDVFFMEHSSECQQNVVHSQALTRPRHVRGVCEYYAACQMSAADYKNVLETHLQQALTEDTLCKQALSSDMSLEKLAGSIWNAKDKLDACGGMQTGGREGLCKNMRHSLVRVAPLRIVDDTLLVKPFP